MTRRTEILQAAREEVRGDEEGPSRTVGRRRRRRVVEEVEEEEPHVEANEEVQEQGETSAPVQAAARVQQDGSPNMVVLFDIAPTAARIAQAKQWWGHLDKRASKHKVVNGYLGQRSIGEVVHFNLNWAMSTVLCERNIDVDDLPNDENSTITQIRNRGWVDYFKGRGNDMVNLTVCRLFMASIVQVKPIENEKFRAYIRGVRVPFDLKVISAFTGVPTLPEDGPDAFWFPEREGWEDKHATMEQVSRWLFNRTDRVWLGEKRLSLHQEKIGVRRNTWVALQHLCQRSEKNFVTRVQAKISYHFHAGNPICLNRIIMCQILETINAEESVIPLGVLITDICRAYGVPFFAEDACKNRRGTINSVIIKQSYAHVRNRDEEPEYVDPQFEEGIRLESRIRPQPQAPTRHSTSGTYASASSQIDAFLAEERFHFEEHRRSMEEVAAFRFTKWFHEENVDRAKLKASVDTLSKRFDRFEERQTKMEKMQEKMLKSLKKLKNKFLPKQKKHGEGSSSRVDASGGPGNDNEDGGARGFEEVGDRTLVRMDDVPSMGERVPFNVDMVEDDTQDDDPTDSDWRPWDK